MPYRIEAQNILPAEIKRIAGEQITKAQASLEKNDDDGIHDVRKRMKKIRALVRMVRDHVGEDVYQEANQHFRDAARRLAPLRDSYMIQRTFERLRKDILQDYLDQADIERIAQALQQQYDDAWAAYADGGQAAVMADLQTGRGLVAGWHIEDIGFDALHDGLKRVYKRGYKRMDDAYDSLDAEDFHEWRKRAKYLWYHMRLLKSVWTETMDDYAAQVHQLADYLGDAHDLAVLEDYLDDDEAARKSLMKQLKYKRKEFETLARPLGQRIYAETPKAFVKRMGRYWDAWQTEQIVNFLPDESL